MAITGADGSIILTTKVDTSGVKQGMNEATRFARLSTNEQRRLAQSLSGVYRKQGLDQSAAQKKAWKDLKDGTVAAEDYKKAIQDVKNETDKATKSTKKYGEQAQKSGGTAKSAFSSIGAALNKLALVAAAAFSVQKIIQFGAEASELATKTEASVQRLIDIYGEASQAVGDFIDANAQALGMSRTAAASYASVYGNLFSVWADQQANAALTTQYLQMTAVVASKTGRTVEDVQERIRSGLLGNTEAIEDLGIFVNIKTIEMTDAFQRMANGKSWEQLDAYTQQQIRSMAILEQATAKYGNEVAQTSALTKSQFRAAWQDFQATWGQVVNRVLIPVLEVLTDILVTSTAVIQSLFNISSATISQSEAIEEAKEKQDELTSSVKETEKATKKALAGFDDLQILSGDSSKEEETATSIVLPEVDLTVSKNEVSAFVESLSASFGKISESVKKAWDSEPVQAFFQAAKTYGGLLWDYWSNLGASLWENLKTTWNNIKFDFNTMTSDMSGLWTTFWQDVQVGIDTWGQPIIDGVSGVFNSMWTTAIDPYIQLMVGAWSDFTSILMSKWKKYGKPLIKNIGKFATNVVALFQSIYNNVLEPIITPFLQTMSSLWDEHISVMIDKVVDFVMKLANGALEIYNKFIHPIVIWITETLEPIFTWIGNYISGVFHTIISTVSDVLGGVFDALGGLIDFIAGVFTGDWEKAWDGISQYFKGVWEGFGSLIKGVLNIIVDALNVMINGMNLISFDIPNWDWLPNNVQGKSFGINIPNIPRLAQGTVVPPNKEFMAVLGDNTKEHEIVSPISTMKQAFTEAILEMGGTGQTTKEEHYYLDENEIMRIIYKLAKRGEQAQGTDLLESW